MYSDIEFLLTTEEQAELEAISYQDLYEILEDLDND